MNRNVAQTGAFLGLLALASGCVACRQASALAGELDIPTATVKQADLQLQVETTGALRTKETRVIAAPSIGGDRKSTRLNSSHRTISYAVFCLKKKKNSR